MNKTGVFLTGALVGAVVTSDRVRRLRAEIARKTARKVGTYVGRKIASWFFDTTGPKPTRVKDVTPTKDIVPVPEVRFNDDRLIVSLDGSSVDKLRGRLQAIVHATGNYTVADIKTSLGIAPAPGDFRRGWSQVEFTKSPFVISGKEQLIFEPPTVFIETVIDVKDSKFPVRNATPDDPFVISFDENENVAALLLAMMKVVESKGYLTVTELKDLAGMGKRTHEDTLMGWKNVSDFYLSPVTVSGFVELIMPAPEKI